MRATGIVKRIDDLGRFAIPREIRRAMGIKENAFLEIFIDAESGGLVLTPYHSETYGKINAIAESLEGVGTTPEHWEIAKELKEIAEKLEKIDD